MKVLAGVDEAGLGPALGPLVTAAAALLVPDGWEPDAPWLELASAYGREWRGRGGRTVVADSKILYRRGGMAALETAAGTFSLLANGAAKPPVATPGLADGVPAHACYSRDLLPFPLHAEAEKLVTTAREIEAVLERAGARATHLEIALAYETVLNRRFRAGLNKNQVLQMEAGCHLVRVVEKYAELPILLIVDKLGGRDEYLSFLNMLFPGEWFEECRRGRALSVYRWRRPGGEVEIRFQAKADASCFATALASLAAKYARERAMAEFNAWFGRRLPDIRPTAGYPVDAGRWLRQARAAPAAALGLEQVVRLR